MAGRKQKNNELIASAALALAIGGYVAYVINNHYWTQLALIVLLALAIPGLAFITQVRTKCLVTFTATSLPCQNPTRGIIFGCRGQNHYRVKALARFGNGNILLAVQREQVDTPGSGQMAVPREW